MDLLFRGAQCQSVVLWLHLSTMNGNVLHSKWGGGASLTLLRLLGSPQEDKHRRETRFTPWWGTGDGRLLFPFPAGQRGPPVPPGDSSAKQK